jgi:hypothetical protein
VKRLLGVVLLACVPCLTVACHAGGYGYDQVRVDLSVTGRETVAVATLDHREAVVGQGRPPNFAGVLKESSGSSLTVRTKSGDSLASDFSSAVQGSLERGGFSVRGVELDSSLSEEQAFERLRATQHRHLVLLIVKRWESQTDKNTELYFDLELSVRNASGALKGKGTTNGTDQFPETGDSSFAEVEAVLQGALGRKLSTLFGEPKIQEAFRRSL